MTTQPTVDAALTPQSPDPTLATAPVVPQRSARRATARRASTRRAAAREHTDDLEGRIVEYLKDHPQSTTGDVAKALNANRDTIAAGLAHIARAGAISKGSSAR
jgi:predicted HTH transcriptional regulator